MARNPLFRRFQLVFSASCVAMTMLVGCQSAGKSSADLLPGPNFAGPVIEQPARVPPIVTAKVETPKGPTQVKPNNIPAAWLPLANAQKREWKWIVIHHSATSVGGAKRFERDHKAKGWDELGYHFVIGNGTESGDGEVEVGGRWPAQKHGAHAKTPDNQFNDHGIGICLVGNFEETRPTAKQIASLNKLVAYLADRYGVRQSDIITHKMTGKQTDCPGRNFDVVAVRAAVAKQRSALAEEPPRNTGELMQSASR